MSRKKDFRNVVARPGHIQDIWRRFKRNKIAMVGLIIFLIIFLLTILAGVIVPYEKALEMNLADRLQAPSWKHLFGTDNYGREIFARVLHGAQRSLLVGIGAVIVGITVGGILGSIAGFVGGWVDQLIMRIVDTIVCIPFMLLVLTIVVALGPSLVNVLIALTISYMPVYVRLIRSSVLTVVGADYIEAARSCGTPMPYIILKHVLPNAIGPIIVQATMTVGTMIINAAGTSFLGMGIQPPTPEWGAMLSEAKNFMLDAPYMVIFPGMAIALTALSLNLMGDGLRDALDPMLKD